jgi:uncharacterized protein YhaN
MRLVSLKLERYGCFADKELVFRPGAALHLVFGENEAGKSTSLSAITDLLFGIEPRTAYDYQHSGQLSLGGTITTDSGQEFTLRRRKGTKNTLLDVNGKPIPEDSLERFLHGLTRSAFSSAFGMDAESLRAGAGEMLKSGGDSGVSLFAAAAGVRGLTQLQKSLIEKSELIFTPRRSGSRLFYQALDRFETAKEDLRRLELKERDLRELRKGIEESQEQLEDLRKKRSSLVTEREQLQRDKDIAPLLRQIDLDENSLDELSELPSWDRVRIKAFRDAQAKVSEMERSLEERTNEETELTAKSNEYSIDSNLLAQTDEIEQLFALTGNYASQARDLPRVRDELRGYGQELANVARRLGIKDAESLSSMRPTDSLVARIRKLAQTGRHLESDLEEKDRIIEGVREELEKLKSDQVSEDVQFDIPTCRQTFEAIRPTFGRLPELRRLELTSSNLGEALAEATSQMSPAVSDLDALAITSLPSSAAIEDFSNRFDEHVASERALHTQQKSATDSIAAIKRRIASMKTGNALGSPDQIAHARQARETLWMPLRSTLLHPSKALPAEQIPESVIGFERSTLDADRLADSAVSDAEQVAELAALSSQLEEAEATLAGIERDFESLRLSAAERDREWDELWREVKIAPNAPREMSQWLVNVQALFKDRAELRSKRLELEEIATSIKNERTTLDELAIYLGITEIAKLSDEAAFSATENALRRLEEQDASLARVRALINSAEQRMVKAQATRHRLEDKHSEWLQGWKAATSDLHAFEATRIDETEASLAAWDEFPPLLKEQKARQRRIEGIERDMRAFEVRVDALFKTLGRKLDVQMSKDGTIRLINKELKGVQASDAALAQIKSQLKSCGTRNQLAAGSLKEASTAFDLICAELPTGGSPAVQVELIEDRQAISERIRQKRESLIVLAQGEAEEHSRIRLEGFVEDQAAGRLVAMKDEEQQLADEINETYARWKELTARLESATDGIGAEAAAQQSKNAEAELLANAREWAVYRFGQLLLSRAIEEHRTQNQNPLMRRAGELFQLLTGGSFVGVEEEFDEKDNPKLVGKRNSGRTVSIEGLSQGTRDQLYLSLRLAYLEEYSQKVDAVPFIGDDLLTTWDDKRALKGLQALAATSPRIQPILFTHHSRILELARSALQNSLDVIDLTVQ